MKVLVLSIGSRGDVEPFLAVAKILTKAGHEVECCFVEQYRFLVEKIGLPFHSLGTELIDLISCKEGKVVLGKRASLFTYCKSFLTIARKSIQINKKMLVEQKNIIDSGNFDQIIFNAKCVYPYLFSARTSKRSILLSPVPYLHYVKGHPSIGFKRNLGVIFNKLSYTLMNAGIKAMVKKSAKWTNEKNRSIKKDAVAYFSSVDCIYSISPSLFSCPPYFPKNVQVLGFHEMEKTNQQPLTNKLNSFIDSHDKILFLSFGSMVNKDPQEITDLFLDIFEKHQIPAVINTAGGALVEPKLYNKDLFCFVSDVPYTQIFPKMYACIHHGGSGTTHQSLKYGCPTLIIPHIIDQYIWNDISSNLAAGPKGISIHKISKKNLEPKIVDLFENSTYKDQAKRISMQMQSESFTNKIVDFVQNPP